MEATGKVANVTTELDLSFYFTQIHLNLFRCKQLHVTSGCCLGQCGSKQFYLAKWCVTLTKRKGGCLPLVSVSLAKTSGKRTPRRMRWQAVSAGRLQEVRGGGYRPPGGSIPRSCHPLPPPITLTLPSLPSRMTQNRTSLEFFVSRLALKSSPLGLPSTKALTWGMVGT